MVPLFTTIAGHARLWRTKLRRPRGRPRSALWICRCAWTTLTRRPQLHRASNSKTWYSSDEEQEQPSPYERPLVVLSPGSTALRRHGRRRQPPLRCHLRSRRPGSHPQSRVPSPPRMGRVLRPRPLGDAALFPSRRDRRPEGLTPAALGVRCGRVPSMDWWTIVIGSAFVWTLERMGTQAAERVHRDNLSSLECRMRPSLKRTRSTQ